jgi:hypothetical protein
MSALPVRRKARLGTYVDPARDESADRSRPAESERLLIATACAAVGAVPALLGQRDPVLALAWLAAVCFPLGVFAGALRLPAWPFGLAVPGVWMVLLAGIDARAGGRVPAPLWSAAAWTGLFAVGAAIGSRGRARPWRALGLALLFTGPLALWPMAGGGARGLLGGRPPGEASPEVASRLFDLSPVTLVVECGGVDWMRHRAVYPSAGTEWFSDRRRPFRGRLAGSAVLLVGCLGLLITRPRVRANGEPRHRASATPRDRD